MCAQDLPAYTLLGEFCGVVKTGQAIEAESADDPVGFGGLMNDKIKDFNHSHTDSRVTGALIPLYRSGAAGWFVGWRTGF